MFKILPLNEEQRELAYKSDLPDNGMYRVKSTCISDMHGSRFRDFCIKRFRLNVDKQLVVQLNGCPLNCWDCVSDRESEYDYVTVAAEDIVQLLRDKNLQSLYFVGGSSVKYMEEWLKIICLLDKSEMFHADVNLIEREYPIDVLKEMSKRRAVLSVQVQGMEQISTSLTGIRYCPETFWGNLNKLVNSKVNFYFIYTGMSAGDIKKFKCACEHNLQVFRPNMFWGSFVSNRGTCYSCL